MSKRVGGVVVVVRGMVVVVRRGGCNRDACGCRLGGWLDYTGRLTHSLFYARTVTPVF